MVDKRFRVPLSPPTSPRMSDFAKSTDDHGQHASKAHVQSDRRSYREHSDVGLGSHEHVSAYPHDPSESSMRYKSFAYSSEASESSYHRYHPDAFTHNAPGYGQQPELSRGPGSAELHSTTTYGTSGTTSLDGRLTPRSPDASVRDQQDDDDLIDSAGEDQDEGAEKVEMTAAELRAHKRKMKRFRLTHSQTRFLMSEFARQAHPDAGHRERLAREIPGLSARQVQVWFQNRRAKLKRHTTDDQARMMRSRAMPEDFDTTQALHSPFGAQQPHLGAPFPPVGTYSAYGDQGGVRPLTLDTTRGVADFDQYAQPYATSTGVSPALGAFALTPPHSGADHISPMTSSTISPYAMHQAAYESSRRGPVSLPAFEHTYAPLHHTQRLPLHDRIGRTYGESTSSSLRTSISHSGLGALGGQPRPLPERAASFSDQISYNHQHSQPPRSVGVTESEPYGAGYPYHAPHSYPSNGSPQERPTAVNHTTEPDQFRRVPTTLAYGLYPPTNYTSAPYQNYQPQYASREAYGSFPQQVHTTNSQEAEGLGSAGAMPPSY